MDRGDVTVMIPAYDEGPRLRDVVEEVPDRYDVLVVDDGSSDGTAAVAQEAGATVLEHGRNRGYVAALRTGFAMVEGDVVVTLVADSEHDPRDIDRLVEPIEAEEADLVFGVREGIPRPSDRLLNYLVRFALSLGDTGTGFRALRTDLARQLELERA